MAAALVASSREILRSIHFGADGARAGKGPPENERVLEAEAKVVRYGRREGRWAELALDAPAKTLWFIVRDGEANGSNVLVRVPLFDFAEFEFGTDEEWVGDAGSRELREMARQGAGWVIVTQTASQGVLVIARSGGSKREMAELHRALLAAFVGGRPALRARLDEVAGHA